MTDDTYNGYPNYESWAVALWIDNEQGTQEQVLQLARDARELPYPTTALEDSLKDLVEADSPTADEASMYADLLGHAIGRVDFRHPAQNYFAQLDEEV